MEKTACAQILEVFGDFRLKEPLFMKISTYEGRILVDRSPRRPIVCKKSCNFHLLNVNFCRFEADF